MLAIILGILKFIGLLLLGILGLLLAIIFIVLLVPLRYRAGGSYYGELKGAASVSWLLHILSCQVKYDGETDMCIRVFGIRIGGRKKPKTDEAEDVVTETEVKAADRADTAQTDISGADTVDTVGKNVTKADTGDGACGEKPISGAEQKAADLSADEKKRKARKKQEEKKRKKSGFGNPIEKIRVTFQGICDKLKLLKEKKDQALAFINQEDNRRTFRLIKRQAVALIKHILPGKIKGRIRFGFDDPYTTGQILTWVSPFYGLYARNLQLIPEFEESVVEGELNLKGRIRIGTLLAIAVRIYMDKNFRVLLKKWRQA